MSGSPWADPDPRGDAPLAGFLRGPRHPLELKCAGLDPDDLARRSVEPSTMSLLGLVRHLADVERSWFRRVMPPGPREAAGRGLPALGPGPRARGVRPNGHADLLRERIDGVVGD